MTLINYNAENFKEVFLKIDDSNKEILTSLNNIYHEVLDIDTILNTPKSKEIIPDYNNYLEEKINYFNSKSEEYHQDFNFIINSYEDYYSGLKKMTGDQND